MFSEEVPMSRRPIVLVAGLTALFTLGCMCGSVGDMIGEKVGEAPDCSWRIRGLGASI